MQWITDIFEAQSDKARLVTTIIAAIIAISVVLINQWFNSRRARKDKLIEKTEEYFSCLVHAQELISSFHAEIVTNFSDYRANKQSPYDAFNTEIEFRNPDKLEVIHKEFFRIVGTAYMLSSLYLPEIRESTELLKNQYLKLHVSFIDSESLGEYLESSKELGGEIEKLIQEMFKELSAIMKSKMA
jgi:hypothetical protein